MSRNAYISAGDCIKDLCLYNEESLASKAAVYASHLRKVYDDLRIDVTHKTTIKKFYINKATRSLEIPNDLLLLQGIGYIDECSVVQPLWYNVKIPQEILFENGHDCGCQTCGDGHANCNIIKSVTDNDTTVYIKGDPYTRYEKKVVLEDGRVILKTNEPILHSDGNIDYQESEKELCKMDMLPCGCVASTTENTKKLEEHDCGCWNFNTNCGTYNKFQKKKYGFTMDITGEYIVLDETYPYDHLVLKYTTVINQESDYKIPIIAETVIHAGIMYYYHMFNPKSQGNMKGIGSIPYNLYQAEKKKLAKRLRPTDFERALGAMGIVEHTHCNTVVNNTFAYYNRSWIGSSIYL